MRIENTKNISTNSLKILVFGESGVGKTSLAKTTGEPTLIVSAESGLLSLSGSDIDVVNISTDEEGNRIPREKRILRLLDVYTYLNTDAAKKKYKWVFLDSLTEIFQNIVEQLVLEFPDRKDTFPMWGEYAKRTRGLIKEFRDIPHYNVVFSALSINDKDETTGKRFIGIDVQGKISQQLPAYFDEVFYYFIEKSPDGEVRKLLTGKADNVVAKDRSGKLDKFEQPDLSKIANKIKGKK